MHSMSHLLLLTLHQQKHFRHYRDWLERLNYLGAHVALEEIELWHACELWMAAQLNTLDGITYREWLMHRLLRRLVEEMR